MKLFYHSYEFSPVKIVFKFSICLLIIQLHKVEYKLRANRVQISCDIVRLFELLVILYCRKTCLTSRLRALGSSISFAFPAL